MSISILREELLKPLQFVIGAVERCQTMPILANVLLTIKNSKLFTLASDIEVELASNIEMSLSTEKNLATTVSGHKLLNICRSLPQGSVIELDDRGSSIRIKSQGVSFDLLTLPAENFPKTEDQAEKISFSIKQSTLLSIVKRAHFAIAFDHAHHYLNGLLLDIKNGLVRAVASDGHRMSLYSFQDQAANNAVAEIIIPKKAVAELIRLLSDNEDLVTLEIAKNYFRVLSDDFILTTKLIDSTYPNYTKLIPQNCDKNITLNCSEFKNALVRVGVLSNETLKSMRLELRPNSLRMISYNSEREKAEEIMQVAYEDENFDMGFNISYLLDVLSVIKTPNVTMSFKNGKNGIVIKEVDGKEDYLYLVMPFNV